MFEITLLLVLLRKAYNGHPEPIITCPHNANNASNSSAMQHEGKVSSLKAALNSPAYVSLPVGGWQSDLDPVGQLLDRRVVFRRIINSAVIVSTSLH
jgi:hypothetical protein